MGESQPTPSTPSADPTLDEYTQAALIGVSRALASVGRAFVCLNPHFQIVHASFVLDRILGEGAAVAARGRPVEDLLGEELFGEKGPIRLALLDGQRREGWRATLKLGNGEPRLVSLTAAPLVHDPGDVCDPRIAHLVILRPAEEEPDGCAPVFFSGAVACSAAMQGVFRLVDNLRQSEATVLITGESGTGKEVVARAIHQHSPRRDGPFVAVNCGALPADLLESELFGHVRGSFTGAVKDRVGRFELASTGTLFLDEIGDLPMQLQAKLLRVLQEKAFERVGESTSRTTEARIIAATNVDLRRAMDEGRFRSDLFYRLRVVPIEIPPLRERIADISPLAQSLLTRVSAPHGLLKRLSPQAMRALLEYSWPGNVRELSNALEYAVAVARKETILPEDLPREVLGGHRALRESSAAPAAPRQAPSTDPPNVPPDDPDARRLLAALQANHWKRDQTAKALGLSRTTLWRKMRELKLA